MTKKLKTILLLDDNKATNYIHKKFITMADCTENIVAFQNGHKALDYLGADEIPPPELMFVDINMPMMNAWEFLEEYEKLDKTGREQTRLILLTTSLSPRDIEKAREIKAIKEVRIKPLSVEAITNVVNDYYSI